MNERASEMYIGEILMQTEEFPAKLWNVIITDKGFHLVFFQKTSIFEIVVMLSVWFLILWGAIVARRERFTAPYLLLLVVAIFVLDRYRIRNRWKNILQIPFEKRLNSNKQNIHIPKQEIRKIVLKENAFIILTNGKNYRLRYFESLNRQYKNGTDPFEKRNKKIDLS